VKESKSVLFYNMYVQCSLKLEFKGGSGDETVVFAGAGKTHSAGIAIDTLEGTPIELILSDLIEYTVDLDDASSVCLHMLIRSCCGHCGAWDLESFVQPSSKLSSKRRFK
jgi:hypothetical protein